MKRLTGILVLLGVIVAGWTCRAASPPVDVSVELRGVVNRTGLWGLLRVRNDGESAVDLRDENILLRADLSLAPDDREWVDLIRVISGRPRTCRLSPGGCSETRASLPSFNYRHSIYIRWQWDGKAVDGSGVTSLRTRLPLLLGYVPVGGGEFNPPYVEPESGVSNMLAFVVHENMKGGFPLENVPPHELAFLLLNGTAEPLDTSPPLSAESVLHLSAPGIGYSTNITLESSGFERKTIPAGECGQWRIPFEQILAQIPKETAEAIRAADGALDVVWKTGDVESQPLPLILLPPTQAELDAAFLAEHADVPRIDENTDLSLDLRLAGIEDNKPVFLGTMRNNEKHAVLWDDQSRKSSILRVSPRFGMSFDLTRTNYGWQPNIIESPESIVLSISVRKCAEEQRGRRPEIAKVGFVMAGRWEFFKKSVNTIWMAIPGNNSQLKDIHANASWYSIQGQQREGRQYGIVPLLAYVYSPETPPELTCVLWNRTEKPIQVAGSRIIATNAALGYRRTLVLPAELLFPVEVASGAHTDWRIPWSAIIEQIPPDDLARIKAADGKLDLVWQANDLTSPPLPLILDWQGDAE